MYGNVIIIVLSTVQSYGDMKFSPRRKRFSEIITNFAAANRTHHPTGETKQHNGRKKILSRF